MARLNISSGAPWEEFVGYSRAVRIGNQIEISGCISMKEGELIGKGDVYLQARRCIEIIIESLEKAGASTADVIRTRMYVIDIANSWEPVGKAHGEVFKDIKPATSMVEVSALIDPDYLVEIEATAIIQN